MKTIIFLSAAAILAAAVATSCSRSDEPVTGNDRVEVKFSANTAEIRTRVADNSWTVNDPVGIYMIGASGTLAPGNIVEDAGNRQYTADAAGSGSVSFTPEGGEAIYYPVSGNVEFIAYHPYSASVTSDFKLPVSVAEQTDPSAIDALYAKTNGAYNKSKNPVDLQFTHRLVKLAFTIEAGDGVIESLSGLTVNITSQQTAATLNLTDGTVTPEGAASAITANTVTDGSAYGAIVLPNGDVAGMTFTFTTAAGGTYEVAVPAGSWASGKKYTYEVTLKRNEAEITGTVSGWGDGGSYPVTGAPQVAIEGYAGNIDVLYTDASTATIAADEMNRQNPGSTLKSITLVDHPGKTYLIGRVVDPDNIIRLKFDETTGDLLFRDASADGFIPIGSYAEFRLISDLSVQGGKYRQEADLDLMNEEWTPITDNTSHTYFYGEFDGAGKKISNLKIDKSGESYKGLFRSNYGTIRNVHIASGTITAGGYAGGICGANSGQIISCSNAATVSGTGSVGGVVATANAGTVTACYNTGAVSGTSYVGGVAGSGRGKITACYNTGTVSGTSPVGGVAGSYTSGTITACYNTGAVSGTSYVGGVVGRNTSGTITACYWENSTATTGLGIGTDTTTPFTLPVYFTPGDTHVAWGTGAGEENGYWKAGTTDGSRLPQLWYE
jgi:hypothetical protein